MTDIARPTPDEIERLTATANRYLLQVKRWRPEAFRIQYRRLGEDGATAIVWGVFLEDERAPHAGPSRSVELHIERGTHLVVNELHFQ